MYGSVIDHTPLHVPAYTSSPYCHTPHAVTPPTVNIDMTRVLTAVLLQETQLLDSKGEFTIASTYTSWCVCVCVWVCVWVCGCTCVGV